MKCSGLELVRGRLSGVAATGDGCSILRRTKPATHKISTDGLQLYARAVLKAVREKTHLSRGPALPFISLPRDRRNLNGAETLLLTLIATKRSYIDVLRHERRDASSGKLQRTRTTWRRARRSTRQSCAIRREQRISSMGVRSIEDRMCSFRGGSGASAACLESKCGTDRNETKATPSLCRPRNGGWRRGRDANFGPCYTARPL